MSAPSSRPRAAVVHPWLAEGGGSEAVALWGARALCEDFDVDILTMGDTPPAALNAAYGTDLGGDDVRWVRIPVPRLLVRRGDALRSALAVRAARRRRDDYDLVFSSYNVMDIGRRGLQYVSDFSFDDRMRRALLADPGNPAAALRPTPPWRGLYLAAARRLSGQSRSGWTRNLTLANSRWTRGLLSEVFKVESEVVYPPVSAPFPTNLWSGRADGFVTVGRVVPEKRVDELAALAARLHRDGLDVHLHVLGRVPDDAYGRGLADTAAASEGRLWLEGPVYGPAKDAFLLGHKYGLSGCRHEAFGLSVAEMVQAGMIVWVPRGGGQVEIVDHPDLVFDSPDDAAAKIGRVLRDPGQQAALREHLRRRAATFSRRTFMDGIRAAAARLMEERRAG